MSSLPPAPRWENEGLFFFLSLASLILYRYPKKMEKSNFFSLRPTAQRYQNVGLNFLDWQINARTKTRPTAAGILYCLNGLPHTSVWKVYQIWKVHSTPTRRYTLFGGPVFWPFEHNYTVALSDLSACYKPQHRKVWKKQRKQRKNCQIKVDIIFSAFGAGEDEVERVILIFIKKPLIDKWNRANSR